MAGFTRRTARLSATTRVAGRAGKGGAVKIELAVVVVVFGPIILIRFLRSVANRARGARAKDPPQRLQLKLAPHNGRARSA